MSRKKNLTLLTIALLMSSASAFAQVADPTPANTGTGTGTKTTENTANNPRDFLGLGMGIGLSLTVDANKRKERVESASVVNGYIRADTEHNAAARVILESHYFFKPKKPFFIGDVPASNWGHGPFLAIQPGSNEVINSIGFGWMMGFRRDNPQNYKESWNIGVGVMVDPNARVLGDGQEKNQKLPEGETAIRYKTEAQSSLMVTFSFSF